MGGAMTKDINVLFLTTFLVLSGCSFAKKEALLIPDPKISKDEIKTAMLIEPKDREQLLKQAKSRNLAVTGNAVLQITGRYGDLLSLQTQTAHNEVFLDEPVEVEKPQGDKPADEKLYYLAH